MIKIFLCVVGGPGSSQVPLRQRPAVSHEVADKHNCTCVCVCVFFSVFSFLSSCVRCIKSRFGFALRLGSGLGVGDIVGMVSNAGCLCKSFQSECLRMNMHPWNDSSVTATGYQFTT